MNVSRKKKIVFLGMMSRYPVGGAVWGALHYLIGFQRLGYDVYYVEDTGEWPLDLDRNEISADPRYTVDYLARVMTWGAFEDRWAYRVASQGGRVYGLSDTRLADVYRQADVLLALGVRFDDRTSSSWLPGYSFTIPPTRLIHVDIDPAEIEKQIQQHFGALKARRTTPRATYPIPPHVETRYVSVADREAQGSTVSLMIKRPLRELRTVGDYRRSVVEGLMSQMINARFAEIARQTDAPFLAASVGNAVEWYDWYAYTFLATYIAAEVFPKSADNSLVPLLSTFAVFAVGFFMRPVGGLLMGAIADRRAAAVVMPSIVAQDGDQEGLGLVIAEALACECPVIASDLPAIRDVIDEGVTGLLARPGDARDLADKIVAMLRDPGRARTLARRGRDMVLERFDWASVARGYGQLLSTASGAA